MVGPGVRTLIPQLSLCVQTTALTRLFAVLQRVVIIIVSRAAGDALGLIFATARQQNVRRLFSASVSSSSGHRLNKCVRGERTMDH